MDIFSSLNVTQSARNETRIKNTAVENYPQHINNVIATRLNKISAPQGTPPATRKVSYASVLSPPHLSPMHLHMENEPASKKNTTKKLSTADDQIVPSLKLYPALTSTTTMPHPIATSTNSSVSYPQI